MGSKQICEILNVLSSEYDDINAYPGYNSVNIKPKWPCDPFHVLIITILSQRTRDINTRRASDNLFKRHNSIESIANANPDEVINLIYSAGFNKQKGMAIISCCKIIRDKYHGHVPSDTKEMMKLPMVGRKTAACVRSYAMGIPSICVDTHVHRISNLIGIVSTNNTKETEFALMNMTPIQMWSDINRYFVKHGQTICLPNHPCCKQCKIRIYCKFFIENTNK